MPNRVESSVRKGPAAHHAPAGLTLSYKACDLGNIRIEQCASQRQLPKVLISFQPLYSPVNNQTIPLSGHRKTPFDIFQKGYPDAQPSLQDRNARPPDRTVGGNDFRLLGHGQTKNHSARLRPCARLVLFKCRNSLFPRLSETQPFDMSRSPNLFR